MRWQWATFDVHSLEPFYFERHRFGRGRILDAPPEAPESGNVEIGFDAAGRVVVERGYTSVPGRCYETFYEFGDGEVDKYHYDYDPEKAVIHVARYRFANERLVELEHRYRGKGRRHERFEWEGQALAAAANQLIWQNDAFDSARAHVDELARKLNRVDWAARLAATDDCVVFPVDMACGDAIEEIERVAPVEKAALLRERGLI